MSKTIEFYFDFGSPTAYLAHTQMPGLAERTGARVVYRPLALGAVFKITGNNSPGAVPAKSAYLKTQDLPRFVRRYGIPFVFPPGFPINTKLLMRGAVAAAGDDDYETYVDTVFNALWVDGKNMTDAAEIDAVLTSASLDAAQFAARITDDAVKQALITATDEAIERGVFGAPTFFVGEEMFFGQDRLDFVEEAARG
jgi:2-hydroxychromene-2-carboxylate isomerase